MDGSITELSKWRWECAVRDLNSSEYDYDGKQYENSVKEGIFDKSIFCQEDDSSKMHNY